MTTEIIPGISEVDPVQHVAVAHYRARVVEGEEKMVEVIEMANGPALHLDNRELVFGRWITNREREDRIVAHGRDPDQYYVDHLKSLSQ